MSKSCFVIKIDPSQIDKLKTDLEEQGFEIKSGPYLIFHASKRGVQVHLYESLKMTVMGKEKDDFILFYLEPEILKTTGYGYSTETATKKPSAKKTGTALAGAAVPAKEIKVSNIKENLGHMGSDEAGKGDYFGPLCVATCSCNQDQIRKLCELGVQDSKNLTDSKVHYLADKLKALIPYEVVILYPKTYNELYLKFNNLNKMLAWAHSKAISELYARAPQDFIIVDQFAIDKPVGKLLKKPFPDLEVIEKTKAESDVVVAAASILAREAFLTGLQKLSEKAVFTLPKGAGTPVKAAAKLLVMRSGKEILSSVAKLHFKTTQEI